MTHTRSNNHAEEVISKWILIGSCIVIYDRLQFVFSPSLKGHLNFRAKNEFSEIKFFSPNFNISTFKSSFHLTPQTSTFQTEQILVSKGRILANQNKPQNPPKFKCFWIFAPKIQISRVFCFKTGRVLAIVSCWRGKFWQLKTNLPEFKLSWIFAPKKWNFQSFENRASFGKSKQTENAPKFKIK